MAMPSPVPAENPNPFAKAKLYRKAGYKGTLPIPPDKKHPPPKGFTGNQANYPDDDQVNLWGSLGNGNIALRLSKVEYVPPKSPYEATQYELIGIDVDDYKEKNGHSQLQTLVSKLGPLPETVRSSSRWADGEESCIHLFLVPAGYRFLGKAASCIDVIQHGHRYMMVWPSRNPDAGGATYRWRAPNGAYYGELKQAGANGVPVAIPPITDIAILPEAWLDFLSCNRMIATDEPISELSSDELLSWAQKLFNDSAEGMCRSMAQAVEKKIQEVEEASDSHPIMTAAHWQILRLGAEGHSGWVSALRKFNNSWAKATSKKRDSGDFESLAAEIQRSVVGTLSKIQPTLHDYVPDDTCAASVTPIHELDGWEPIVEGQVTELPNNDLNDLGPIISRMYRTNEKSPGEYDQNDHGNAKHFIDLFAGDIKYVDSRRNWILWDGDRWHRDTEEKLASRAYSVVEKRQKAYSNSLPRDDASSIKFAEVWRKWGLRSGNAVQIKNALALSKTLYDDDDRPVALSGKEFDVKPGLLGCDNGILVLDSEPYLRPARKEDYVTYNTHTPYVPWDTQAANEAGMLEGFTMWQDYLDTFLPDLHLRSFIQKALGHLIIGENPEKLIIFVYGPHDTGKSTMLGGLSSALGDYYGTIDSSLFKQRDLNPNLIRAVPLRVTGMSEIDAGRMDANMIKRLTGNDKVTAEAKFSNEIFEGRPQFTTIIACNHEPNIHNADEAVQERILVLPFEYQIASDKRRYDRQVDIERNSGIAVLSWLVEGWKLYCREGLARKDWPVDVKRLCGSVTGHLNATQAFIAECIDKTSIETLEARQRAFAKAQRRKRSIPNSSDWEADWTPSTAQVYELYTRWCVANGERAISLHDLTKELGMGNPQVKNLNGRSTRCYLGFKLKTPEES